MSGPATEPAVLPLEEVGARVGRDGFPELELLWRKFRRSGRSLADLDEDDLRARRRAHMGALTGSPRLGAVALVTIAVGVSASSATG